jgi:hypothetical protein
MDDDSAAGPIYVRTPTGRLARVVGPGPGGRVNLEYVRRVHGELIIDGAVCLAPDLLRKCNDIEGD